MDAEFISPGRFWFFLRQQKEQTLPTLSEAGMPSLFRQGIFGSFCVPKRTTTPYFSSLLENFFIS